MPLPRPTSIHSIYWCAVKRSQLSLKTDQIHLTSQFTISAGLHQVWCQNCELNSTFNSDKERLTLYYWWGLLSNNCKFKSNVLTHRLKWNPLLVLQNIIHVSTVPKSRFKTGLSANQVCPGLENVWCIVKCENTTSINFNTWTCLTLKSNWCGHSTGSK